MNSFYEHHKDSIRWHYRCFDRILLNAARHCLLGQKVRVGRLALGSSTPTRKK